ncbi:uncharacterized protein PAC_20083 [Phialocephala subalpina]|uniref:Uncharacterized protein n=1 Tax=Phialocephala subalpina TaxID=576137 RepID=A0A1L7XYN3_9HELO|nr:uncharacterized protein PAC_20083 [Phialocephala subalpina]
MLNLVFGLLVSSLTTNELTDIDDFLLSLDIQLPNSPETKETPRRLMVPASSTVADGTIEPFIANNEHLDNSLQGFADECVEQTGKDDQSSLSLPRVASKHLEAKSLDFESSSYNNPTQVDTIPQQQAKQDRKRLASAALIHQGQQASETDTLSTIPRDIVDKWNRIAGPEALTQLWRCLWAKRGSPSDKKAESTLETLEPLDPSMEGQLARYQLQYQSGAKGTLKGSKQFAELPWRLYLANISILYMRDAAILGYYSRIRGYRQATTYDREG